MGQTAAAAGSLSAIWLVARVGEQEADICADHVVKGLREHCKHPARRRGNFKPLWKTDKG